MVVDLELGDIFPCLNLLKGKRFAAKYLLVSAEMAAVEFKKCKNAFAGGFHSRTYRRQGEATTVRRNHKGGDKQKAKEKQRDQPAAAAEVGSKVEEALNSMSESLQEGGFGFTDDFGRPRVRSHQQPQIQAPHIAQQLRRDKLRFFPGTSSLDNILEDHQQQHLQQQEPHIQGYESSSMMLSEMFNFQPGADLLGIPSHLHGKNGNIVNWKSHNSGSGNGNSITNDWYSGGRQAGVLNPNPHPHLTSLGVSKESGGNNNHAGHDDDHDNINNNVSNNNNTGNRHENNSGNNIGHHQISSINADAAAMQLFLMNPEPEQPSAPLHMLLPGPSADAHQLQQLHHNFSPTTAFSATANNVIPAAVQLQQLNWGGSGAAAAGSGVGKLRNWGGGGETEGGKIAENQGLSLSLSSLQHLEAAMHGGEGAAAAVAGGKAEELRMDGVVYYPPQAHQSGLYALKSGIVANSVVGAGGAASVPGLQALQVHLGSSPMASVSIHSSMILRNSKYLRAAQELLEEFCRVGRGQIKSRRVGKQESSKWGSTNNTQDTNPSSSQSPHAPLSSSDRFEHQRKKTKLLAMLDEVDRRYNHYCEQMQQVVNSFDSVLGIGAALPYTCLAQKAISRHFRCLRDAIAGQLRTTSELLGEKDVSGLTGITKGETPRLRLLDQTLRQQRAFHQMGMMEQEAWRPQRGLPERSVNILRSWLFEHFLHPYVHPLPSS
ncbi:BEL1-like homeodomain protein 2 [Nymphaea thermarum]|nr:BEL1-like homeodomain protein 2 [Nymphaea thermarum]